ncbi:type VII secretion integral membrane protein EccD [Cellulomonas composti]|uniref:EccD-like transmembrane domain-containing protein n=1 Tax=Cellulomonas composti TaxID=266130 RepID=A0A511JEB2_9CELL|nr:type VII secretion integral membrane protein EccD [Cellulomonas composti]GEL96321.1 hypothetical protein CCO02nite_29790 [Cellulomonas composti]
MTESSAPAGPVGTILRVTVAAGTRRIDLGVPGTVAVVDVVPGLARALGLLDTATVYGGYHLVTVDGVVLDPARSLTAEGVLDGSVLTLETGASRAEPRVYDDVVEAVADAVENRYRPWTPRDSALGAAWGAVALVVAAALLLLAAGPTDPFPPVLAAVGALLVLVSGAVVARVGREPAAGHVLVLAAGVPAAVAGLTAGTAAPGWGWPAAAAGGALVLAGLLAIPALVEHRELTIAPTGLGFALAVTGLIVGTTDAQPSQVLAIVVAVVLTASIGVPWLALASTPLRVVSPRSDAEILLDPAPIDAQVVRRQLDSGIRLQVALRVAVGVLALLAAPEVVGAGTAGTLLLVVGFVGLLLATRQSYPRADVLLVVAEGIVGLALTVLVAAVIHPERRGTLVALATVAAAVLVGVGLVAPRRRIALTRLGDVLEMLALASLLPLGVVAAGLV